MIAQNPGVVGVKNCGLDRGKDLIAVVHKERIERVITSNQNGNTLRPGSSRSTNLLPERCSCTRPTGSDCDIQTGNINPHLQSGSGCQGTQLTRAERGFQGASFLGEKASPVCGNCRGKLGTVVEILTSLRSDSFCTAARADKGQKARIVADQLGRQQSGFGLRRKALSRCLQNSFFARLGGLQGRKERLN